MNRNTVLDETIFRFQCKTQNILKSVSPANSASE